MARKNDPLPEILTRLKISKRFNQWDADFVKFFSFYAGFHTHPLNKLIHVVGIPSIYVATLIMLDSLITSILGPLKLDFLHSLGFSSALLPLYHYASLLTCGAEPLSAMVAGVTFVYYALIASTLFQWLGPFYSLWLGLFIQITGWGAQTYGHWVYDKNSPAVLKQPLLALQSAPYFIVMEVLFALGFRPDLNDASNEVGREVRLFYDMPIVV
eukprot:Gregarina_sp_Pseudo_9__1190@NODE_1784_length_1333_cov_70_515456_g1653_i0_p1_GENE_NODE_1784_length_1333_cov_70_515456_g1653_i0NODE_1784_length_1333_cov_70_515456_g1653_i0_p1_ORF_typecomplete_len213_score14_69DUF962/PF06127_11/3_7e22_NODE_1784_length_1333_cov_70_515456_g1653_i06241262